MPFARGLHRYRPKPMSQPRIAVIAPIAVQTASWKGSARASPLPTKTALAMLATAIPTTPHSNQAGKNAPNRSNDGAAFAQPARQVEARQTRTLLDRVRDRRFIQEAKDAGLMTMATLIEGRFEYRSLFTREEPIGAVRNEAVEPYGASRQSPKR